MLFHLIREFQFSKFGFLPKSFLKSSKRSITLNFSLEKWYNDSKLNLSNGGLYENSGIGWKLHFKSCVLRNQNSNDQTRTLHQRNLWIFDGAAKLLDEVQPDSVAIAFDLKGPTFRHKKYAGYKANRHGMPEELAQQMPTLKELLKDLGYHLVTCEGYEADDILGTFSRACTEKGIPV